MPFMQVKDHGLGMVGGPARTVILFDCLEHFPCPRRERPLKNAYVPGQATRKDS
jgi:hypothetical protein